MVSKALNKARIGQLAFKEEKKNKERVNGEMQKIKESRKKKGGLLPIEAGRE